MMDLPKRNLFSKSIPVASENIPSGTRKIAAFQESDENAMPRSKKEPPSTKNFMSPTISSSTKTKILGERNLADDPQFEATPIAAAHSRASGDRKLSSSCNAPYDPVTNYLSPRPQFLRYDPDRRRREFMQRIEGAEDEDDASSQDEIEDVDDDSTDSDQEEEEDEEEEGKASSCFGMVCTLLLLIGILVTATCYISSMNYPSGPMTSRQSGNVSAFSEVILKSPPVCLLQEDVTYSHFRAPVHVVGGRDDGLYGEELLGETSDAHLVDSRIDEELIQIEDTSDAHLVDSRIDEKLIQIEDTSDAHLEDSRTGDKLIRIEDTSDAHLVDSRTEDELIPIEDTSDAHLVDSRTGDEMIQIEEISDAHHEDSRLVDELIRNYQSISDEIVGRVDLVEEESLDGLELVKGTLNSDDLAAEETNEEVLDQSHELLVKEGKASVAQGSGNGVEKNLRLEKMGMCRVIHIAYLFLRHSPSQTTPLDSLAHQDSALNLPDSSEIETSSGDVQMVESSGLSQVPRDQIDSSTPRLGSEVSSVLGIDLGRGVLYLLTSLTSIFGIFVFLFKYFTKHNQSSKPAPLPSSKVKPVFAKKSTSAVTVRDDTENDGGSKSVVLNHSIDKDRELLAVSSTSTEASFDQKLEMEGVEEGPRTSFIPSRLFNDENEKSYATQPPTVELLGEFDVAQESISGIGSGQKVEREVDEGLRASRLSRSRSERNSSRKRSSAGKVFPTSSGESAQKESPLREQDARHRGEPVQMVTTTSTTPLRRSSRLRNRVTSPNNS